MPKTIYISASSLRSFLGCKRRYMFEYVERLRPVTRAAPLTIGSAVHSGMRHLLSSSSIVTKEGIREAVTEAYAPEEIELAGPEPEIAVEAVCAFDAHVNWRGWDILETEKRFEIQVGHGRRLIGYMDGVVAQDGILYTLEHKTASGGVSDAYLHHLLWDIQATAYIMAARAMGYEVCGVLYNFLPKPTIKRLYATPEECRKYKRDGSLYASQRVFDETDAEYVERVRAWYAENGDLFSQHIATRNDNQLKSMVTSISQIVTDMRRCESTGAYYRNPGACAIMSCPFASICLEDTPEIREANFTVRPPRREEQDNDTE
jgi:hypothetical protein